MQSYKATGHFKVDPNSTSALSDIDFSEADIKAACKQLKASSAPGPDGVPVVLLKKCMEELSTLYNVEKILELWQNS